MLIIIFTMYQNYPLALILLYCTYGHNGIVWSLV